MLTVQFPLSLLSRLSLKTHKKVQEGRRVGYLQSSHRYFSDILFIVKYPHTVEYVFESYPMILSCVPVPENSCATWPLQSLYGQTLIFICFWTTSSIFC